MGRTDEARDLLERLRGGDGAARDRLIELAQGRFVALARAMLRRHPLVRRWEQTDDLLQAALIRLHRSLGAVLPDGVAHFDHLAAAQIRRELIDLARRHGGPEGLGPNHQTDPGGGRLDGAAVGPGPPKDLDDWTAFHEAVGGLPDDERKVTDLLWYGGLSHAQAAEALGTSTKTVQRRWASARWRLRDALGGDGPGAV